MDLPASWAHRNVVEYLVKLREAQAALVKRTQMHLRGNQRQRIKEDGAYVQEEDHFIPGQFVLLRYPNRPPNKLSGLYRGPLVITEIGRPDMIKVKDLISNKEFLVFSLAQCK